MTYHDYVSVDGYEGTAVVLRLTTDDYAEVKFSRGLVAFVPTTAIHTRKD